jgi:uncharacterized protein YbjT (DUF2867 family)
MRIVVVGASGRVGKLVVQEALARGQYLSPIIPSPGTIVDMICSGHNVTALVRNGESLSSITSASRDMIVVKGHPQNEADMEKAFTAAGDTPAVVIVALNNARTSDNPFAKPTSPPTLMHDSHVSVIKAMKKHGMCKLVTLQALGVGDSYNNLFWPVRLLVRFSNMGVGFKDHELVEDVVKKSGIDYVLARPIRFVDGPSELIHFYGNKGDGIGSFNTITRKSVATFLLDAAEKSDWDGSTPVISN